MEEFPEPENFGFGVVGNPQGEIIERFEHRNDKFEITFMAEERLEHLKKDLKYFEQFEKIEGEHKDKWIEKKGFKEDWEKHLKSKELKND